MAASVIRCRAGTRKSGSRRDARSSRIGVRSRIGLEHILASAAIPIADQLGYSLSQILIVVTAGRVLNLTEFGLLAAGQAAAVIVSGVVSSIIVDANPKSLSASSESRSRRLLNQAANAFLVTFLIGATLVGLAGPAFAPSPIAGRATPDRALGSGRRAARSRHRMTARVPSPAPQPCRRTARGGARHG